MKCNGLFGGHLPVHGIEQIIILFYVMKSHTPSNCFKVIDASLGLTKSNYRAQPDQKTGNPVLEAHNDFLEDEKDASETEKRQPVRDTNVSDWLSWSEYVQINNFHTRVRNTPWA